jgi:hypothetical protein
MITSESIDKVCQALFDARNEMEEVDKSARVQGGGASYPYATFRDYLVATSAAMKKHGLTVVFSVVDCSRDSYERTDKNGKTVTYFVSRVTVTARLFHVSGEWIEVQGIGEGHDTQDKACGKAQTYAKKYAMSLLFGLSANEDADKHMSPLEQSEAKAEAKNTDTSEIVNKYIEQIGNAKTLEDLDKVGHTIAADKIVAANQSLAEELRGLWKNRKNDLQKQGAA